MRIQDNLVRQSNAYYSGLAGKSGGDTGKAASSVTASSLANAVQISPQAYQLSALDRAAPGPAAKPQSAPAVIDYTNNIKLTKDKTIDPLLAGGNYWWHTGTPFADGTAPSASANHALSFSFLSSAASGQDANGFQALDATQQGVVRDVLSYISSVVNITFSELGSGGDLKIGSNVQNGVSSGYAYYPNQPTVGGSLYLANDQPSFANASGPEWDAGGSVWTTLIHEFGHALGLKHPGKYNAGGGSTPGPFLGSKDNKTNSIMSYKDDKKYMHLVQVSGSGLQSGYVKPEGFQIFDIAALQYLYGAPASAAATYSFTDGEVFSRTIFNNNAGSKIDLSGMSQDSVVDLRGGNRSSIGLRDAYESTGMSKEQFAQATTTVNGKSVKLKSVLGGVPTYTGTNNLGIARGSQIREAIGGAGNDSLVAGSEIGGAAILKGGAGDDKYFLSSGNATLIDSSGGNDTVYVVKKGGKWSVDAGQTTLTKKDKNGNTLETVDISGIENIGFWSGKSKIKGGKALSLAVLPQGQALTQGLVHKLGVRLDVVV